MFAIIKLHIPDCSQEALTDCRTLEAEHASKLCFKLLKLNLRGFGGSRNYFAVKLTVHAHFVHKGGEDAAQQSWNDSQPKMQDYGRFRLLMSLS